MAGVYQDREGGSAEALGVGWGLGLTSADASILTFFSSTLGILRSLTWRFPVAITSNKSLSSWARIGKGLETWLLSILGRAGRWDGLTDDF